MKIEYSEAVSETLEILKYMDDELLNKIPLDIIKKLKEKKSETYVNKFDEKDGIDVNKISERTKNILAVLYRDYIANEQEKIEFEKMLLENEINGDGKDYNIGKSEKQSNSTYSSEFLPVEIKKNFWQKLINKLFKHN